MISDINCWMSALKAKVSAMACRWHLTLQGFLSFFHGFLWLSLRLPQMSLEVPQTSSILLKLYRNPLFMFPHNNLYVKHSAWVSGMQAPMHLPPRLVFLGRSVLWVEICLPSIIFQSVIPVQCPKISGCCAVWGYNKPISVDLSSSSPFKCFQLAH